MRPANYQFDAFLYAYLMMLGGSLYFLSSFLDDSNTLVKAGDTIVYQIGWLTLYVILIYKLANQAKQIGYLFRSSGVLIAFIIASQISFLANGTDIDSLIKFGMYLMTIAFAAWLATSYNDSVDQTFESLYRMGIVVLILHLVVYPIGHEINWDPLNRPTLLGTMPYAGLFGHKNLAGSFFAITTLICEVRLLSPNLKNRSACFLIMVINVMMLLMSGAMGALVSLCVVAAITLGYYFVIERKYDLAAIYWSVAAIIALVVAIYGVSGILEIIGRDAELTGRSELWSIGTLFFWQHPAFGYGYANFFRPDGPGGLALSVVPWQPKYGSFDNSYLEIGIQLGLVGGLFFCLILLKGVLVAVRFSVTSTSIYRLGPIALLSYILISSISDSYLLLHNYIFSAIIFWAYFGLQHSTLNEHALVETSYRTWMKRRRRFSTRHATKP